MFGLTWILAEKREFRIRDINFSDPGFVPNFDEIITNSGKFWIRGLGIGCWSKLIGKGHTVCFYSGEIGQKVFLAFDNIFHVYLMKGFQKYERN